MSHKLLGRILSTMKYSAPALLFFLLVLALSAPVYAQNWNGILSSGRAIDWSNAGIPGGVPTGWSNCTTTACNTAYSTPTAANINTACAGAPDNSVVRIPAGTYSLSTSIHCNRSNVILRGAGPTQTTLTLNGHNVLMGNGSGGQGSTPSGLGSKTLSTLTKGSTVLTVASTSGMSVGQVVAITESNPAWVNATGNEGNENSTWCTGSLNFFGCSANSVSEMAEITNVNAGANQITIAAPGLSQTYSSGLSPKVIYWSTSGVYKNNGVENMKINASNTDFAVALTFCHSCWVKNVAVINTARSGVYSFFGYRDEIRDSYISASNSAGAPTEYGIEVDRGALVKIENNIIFGVTSPTQVESSYGVVLGYNYALNTAVDNQFPGLDFHRAHTYMALEEGNIASNTDFDFVWGSSSHNTVFRNRFSGKDPNKVNYFAAIKINAWNRYINLVANVIGTTGVHSYYECSQTYQRGNDNSSVFDLGFNNTCGNGTSGYDATTYSSLMRWGNWDTVTNATRYCTGSGTPIAACPASETASTDGTFPGLASPSTSFPASFYLSSKPSWFGSVPWPAIGPDVTGGNITSAGGHANKIPAQICYESTTKTNGFLTAFDASACYNSGTTSDLPASPSGLTGTIIQK
jgi:hypothetical protein